MIRELGSKMLYYYINLGLRFGGVSFTNTVFGCGENAALHCRTNVDYCCTSTPREVLEGGFIRKS